ncbi:unnamed protein product (macronuclear) [Paramecium tetraurelia]|uniref:Uncharacterized protein n=1 Tax=Paramecium tetraurelia TaxID=5888 RepID=A0DQ09_PARTE|nr:uncharacterized protein GSPATT00002526001 [Paramecium tetraurelia]CAK85126.1 unnamed protein product [Paramecium tetraurelia]|eukprot:XP_001452523.1 hypothetical protein (macronuclear) [Paramecium tetraurelia strain d4-2]
MGNANSDRFHENSTWQNANTRSSIMNYSSNSDESNDSKSKERPMYSITKNPIVQRRKLKQHKLQSNKLNLLTYEAFGAYY